MLDIVLNITFTCNCIFFPLSFRLSSAWKLCEMFLAPFMRLTARAKSETIIYNVFPPDVWLTPWVNETLASSVRSKRVFDYSSSSFFLIFFSSLRFYVATLRRSEKRVVKPWRAYSGAIPGAALHSLPYHRSDSFHSSAFDHPRRRIRYSNASESARLSLLPTLFRPFRP